MSLPQPIPGQVIGYSYLWRSEHERGQTEGLKDRPCALLLAMTDREGRTVALALPITHRPPQHASDAVEIPAATKARLGLDDQRSWIMLTEANRFVWPGPDLRFRRRNDPSSVVYGVLPRRLFEEVRARFVERARAGRAGSVQR